MSSNRITGVLMVLLMSYSSLILSQNIRIKYLANEGLFISNDGVNILIDALFEENFGIYQQLPLTEKDSIIKGNGVYKKIHYYLISHIHQDHYSQKLVHQFLINHPETTIISSNQVIANLQELLPDFKYVIHDPGLFENIISSEFEDIIIQSYWFRHPYPKNFKVKNFVFIVKSNTSTVAHFGDSEWNPDMLSAGPFKNLKIDYAFLPVWYFIEDSSEVIVEKYIDADQYFIFHYPENLKKSQILSKHLLLNKVNTWIDLD